MPKMKTSSAAKKRFKRVGARKIKRARAFKRHLLTKKSAKRKRHLRQGTFVHGTNLRKILVLLPN